MSFLYGDVAPSLMTDEQIEYTLRDIDVELAACAKLKPGPWDTTIHTGSHSWQDEAAHIPVRILAPRRSGEVGAYDIAGGTIYNTQNELFFMAAMREEYPALLGRLRALLIYIRELRKKVARKKARR